MKISVELSDEELDEISRLTGISKKGPAIRSLLVDAIQYRRRAEISGKFLTGEWSAELSGYESANEADRSKSDTLDNLWR